MAQLSRRMRQEQLRGLIEEEPFLTDGELAARFDVSVQTIRLDRLSLGIPELRERVKAVASSRLAGMRALEPTEVFGEIIDLELGEGGISVWRAEVEHSFLRSSIVRGHYIFAQANSLAVAIVNADRALTAKATIRFLKTVAAGATLVAKARVIGERHGYTRVDVQTKADGDPVFAASFLLMRTANQAHWEDDDENRD